MENKTKWKNLKKIHANNTIKQEELLEANLEAMYTENGKDGTHMGYYHVIAITNYYPVKKKDRSHYKSTMINLLHIKRYVSNWVLLLVHQKAVVPTC